MMLPNCPPHHPLSSVFHAALCSVYLGQQLFAYHHVTYTCVVLSIHILLSFVTLRMIVQTSVIVVHLSQVRYTT